MPSVPQGVSALSTGSTTVLATWMEPAVYFRECIHDWNAAIDVHLHVLHECLSCWLLRMSMCSKDVSCQRRIQAHLRTTVHVSCMYSINNIIIHFWKDHNEITAGIESN